MQKNLGINMLLDFYGVMLTGRQREIMEYYYDQDFSLSEISEQTGITRQGVMNCLRKSEQHLFELERKLGLVLKMRELERDISELEGLILQSEMTNEAVMADIDEKMVEIKQKL